MNSQNPLDNLKTLEKKDISKGNGCKKRKYNTQNVPPPRTLDDLTPFQQKIISPYLPFIPASHHSTLFQLSPDNENPKHIHALIFSVWTLSQTVQEGGGIHIPDHFLSLPFHSFLFHISNTY